MSVKGVKPAKITRKADPSGPKPVPKKPGQNPAPKPKPSYTPRKPK